MKKIALIIPLLIGGLNATEITKPKVEITKEGITYALNKNYAQLMLYSEKADTCYRELSEKKRDDLETCENYQQIVKDIEVRIERLEDLKRRYYNKDYKWV